jgi:FkbH-like protein
MDDTSNKRELVIAATFTAEPVSPSLRYWLHELGLGFEVAMAGYAQVFQELLDPASAFARNRTGANVVLVRPEDWIRDAADAAGRPARIAATCKELIAALQGFVARQHVPLLVLVTPPSPAAAGLAEPIAAAERALADAVAATPGSYFTGSAALSAGSVAAELHDAEGDRVGHLPYTPEFYALLGTRIARLLSALNRAPFKVIVLDCDNTLWGGVCGEDGPAGVRIEAAHRLLQETMLREHDRGMLLCLCSKNEAADVAAVFAQRSDMVLKPEHFAAQRVNWAPKSRNLRELARELNVGSDSLVLLDDNPAECAEVAANCPEALALQVPESGAEMRAFLEHAWALDRLRITDEDRKRAQSYREARLRTSLQESVGDFAQFIAALDLRVTIGAATTADLPRVAQLTERTNQFNLSTRRRTVAEIAALAQSPTHEVLAVRVADRFGDYGLVGAVVLERRPDAVDIDTFLLSCRVLGRGVEHRIMAQVGALARQAGALEVRALMLPTRRNQPARDFLQRVAGELGAPSGEGTLYRIPAAQCAAIEFDPSIAPEPVADDSAEDSKAPAAAQGTDLALRRVLARIAHERLSAAEIHRRSSAARRTAADARSSAFVAPSTPTEKLLAGIWSEFLGIESIGVDDNFFDLGGDSVTGVQIISRAAQRGARLTLKQQLEHPTIAALARLAQVGEVASAPAAAGSAAGRRPFGLARLSKDGVQNVLARLRESRGN